MGSRTDWQIRAWQEHAGLAPALPKRAEALNQLQRLAFDLIIKVCELERSGIRDGDGNWYGCEPLLELIGKIGRFAYPSESHFNGSCPQCGAGLPPLPPDLPF